MRPKAEWANDSEPIRARGIIVNDDDADHIDIDGDVHDVDDMIMMMMMMIMILL